MFRKRGRLEPTRTSVFVLVHVVAAYAVWRGIAVGFPWQAWVAFGLMWAMAATGISVGYHRLLTHKTFQCSPGLEKLLYALAAMAVEGDGATWGKTHAQHHAFADQPGDPHRPNEYERWWERFLWSHCGWIFFRNIPPPRGWKPSPRFGEDPSIQWQKEWHLPLVTCGFLIPAAIAGWDGLLLGGFLRVALCWHVTWSTNSLCHMFGDQAHDLKSPQRVLETRKARNFPLMCLLNILALVSWGEFWHANHHARQNSASLGWRWYEFDPGAWVILALERLGLIWNVKTPQAAR